MGFVQFRAAVPKHRGRPLERCTLRSFSLSSSLPSSPGPKSRSPRFVPSRRCSQPSSSLRVATPRRLLKGSRPQGLAPLKSPLRFGDVAISGPPDAPMGLLTDMFRLNGTQVPGTCVGPSSRRSPKLPACLGENSASRLPWLTEADQTVEVASARKRAGGALNPRVVGCKQPLPAVATSSAPSTRWMPVARDSERP
jgi:hypothetical protein